MDRGFLYMNHFSTSGKAWKTKRFPTGIRRAGFAPPRKTGYFKLAMDRICLFFCLPRRNPDFYEKYHQPSMAIWLLCSVMFLPNLHQINCLPKNYASS